MVTDVTNPMKFYTVTGGKRPTGTGTLAQVSTLTGSVLMMEGMNVQNLDIRFE
jgi:hypothetical protein